MPEASLLIHPTRESALYDSVTRILERAVVDDPDHYSHIIGATGVVDHYGYSNGLRSAVILSEEYHSAYMRLSIRQTSDGVERELKRAVSDYYALNNLKGI